MHLTAFIKMKPTEQVVHVLRRHPLTFLPYFLLFIVLLFVPFALYQLISNLFPEFFLGPVVRPLSILAASIFYLSSCLFFFGHFIMYYLDVWVVTTERMIDIEQFGLFSRSISELELFQVQDVTTDVHGVFPTFFNYGDVSIKTASSNASIVAKQVHNPNRVREAIVHLADADRRTHQHIQNPPTPTPSV